MRKKSAEQVREAKKRAEQAFAKAGDVWRERLRKIQESCNHDSGIERGTYTFDHNSYSQTWNEGPTRTCRDCGLHEEGYSGILFKKYVY